MNADLDIPPFFSGVVRLFPLPNLVLLPGVIQALHIFEPRYRKLMEDSLAGDQLITMSLLKPGWETEVGEEPPIHDIVCVGKIVTHAKLEDGRYNLLICGAKRARIIREIAAEQPYRLAHVQLIDDENDGDEQSNAALRDRLLDVFQELSKSQVLLQNEAIKNLLTDEMPVGLLTDLVGFSLGISTERLQKILATFEIEARANMLIQIIESQMNVTADQAQEEPDFPPRFTDN